MENISKHITYAEAIHSNTAKRRCIDNTPNPTQVENMKLLAEKVFEPLREWPGVLIFQLLELLLLFVCSC